MSELPISPLLERALAAPETAPDPTDERILDAALELVGAYGARNTSMDELAQRAGVNRRTVFRRFGSKDGVVDALSIRETRRLLALVRDVARAAPDPATSVVEVFVTTVRWGRTHPWTDRVARVEPDALIRTLRAQEMMDMLRGFVAGQIRSGQRRGAVPKRDADQTADVLIRLAISYILIPTTLVDTDDDEALRAFARAAIAPILTAPRP